MYESVSLVSRGAFTKACACAASSQFHCVLFEKLCVHVGMFQKLMVGAVLELVRCSAS
jgi:hypothetical protein